MTRLWHASAPLTATGLLMLALLAAALVGLALDPRVITGAPAWLKPAKFAASIAIYSFTLAWIFSLIPAWTRTRRIVGWTTAIAMVLEIAIIGLQAWRGTTSHFNVGTLVDGMLFTVMGAAIVGQTLSTVAVAVALWREEFEDRALGWALRWGVVLTIVGAFTGGLMTRPTSQQLEEARAGRPMTIVGAHTVGAPDGGPGLPGTGWSTRHGDLRVAHFAGLHAMQALPMIAWVLARRRLAASTRARLMLIAAASYAGLFGILLLQGLRGVPVIAPDALTATLLASWVASTGVATALALRRPQLVRRPAIA